MNLEEYHEVIDKVNNTSRAFVEKEGLMNHNNNLSFYAERKSKYILPENKLTKYLNISIPFYQITEIISKLEFKKEMLITQKGKILFTENGRVNTKSLKSIDEQLKAIDEKLGIALERFSFISQSRIEGAEVPRYAAELRGYLLANRIVGIINGDYHPQTLDYTIPKLSHPKIIYEKYQELMGDMNNRYYYRHPDKVAKYLNYLRQRDPETGMSHRKIIRKLEKEYANDLVLKNPGYVRHETPKLDVTRIDAYTTATQLLPMSEEELLDIRDAVSHNVGFGQKRGSEWER